MKLIRYTLLSNGKVPQAMVDGGYFPKPNGGKSPQDYDLIGLSNGWSGLQEFTTKIDFENYIKSFSSDTLDEITGDVIYILQDQINIIWSKNND